VFISLFLWTVWGIPAVADAQEGKVIVPNVEGISQDVAAEILRTVGLHPQVVHKRGHSPIIVQQEPKPGLLVPVGTTITVSTAAPATAVVPGETQPYSQGIAASQETSSIQGHVPGVQSSVKSTSEGQATSYLPWYPKKFRSQTQPTSRVFRIENLAHPSPRNILQANSAPGTPRMSVLVSQAGWQAGWSISNGNSVPAVRSTPGTGYLLQAGPAPETPRMSILVSQEGWQAGWSTPNGNPVPTARSTPETGMTIKSTPENSVAVISVPYVIRLQQRDASEALSRIGLAAHIIERVQDTQLKAGIVLRQFPVAGSVVPVGTYVNLWVVE